MPVTLQEATLNTFVSDLFYSFFTPVQTTLVLQDFEPFFQEKWR
jgi:hypothetical protein